jgi:hypothetical protein
MEPFRPNKEPSTSQFTPTEIAALLETPDGGRAGAGLDTLCKTLSV